MILRIDRAWKKPNYTISRVSINNTRFGDGSHWCSILEDKDRGLHSAMSVEEILKIKVPGQTAIPRGVYEINITFSPKFQRNMPLLLNVPGFSGIRIHSANNASQLEGCLAPGFNNIVGCVTNSRYWTNLIEYRIREALKKERVYIEVL